MKPFIIIIAMNVVSLIVAILNKTMDGWMTNEFLTGCGVVAAYIWYRKR